MGHSWPLFLYFRLFNTVDSKQVNVQNKSLPMTGFKPRTSGIRSNRSTNWATTTAPTSSVIISHLLKVITTISIYQYFLPGLVVMGRDSRSKGHEFESRHHLLDGHFSHIFVVKIVMFVQKDRKETKKRPGLAHFLTLKSARLLKE